MSKTQELIGNSQTGNSSLGVVMPRSLTAENGAKALLIGEFFEEIEVPNEEYCGCGECDYCIEIQDEDATETVIQKVPVSWDTVKRIYEKVVTHYGA
ncbi:hypothetical protein [Sunxiuqinia indica]|uniref:hypothetical protein n=1 Tax=Sunxiuqinia indica TaxID=2692584 RepID=UPI00135BF402|nr:hypothetical protein [Sunxiuqinia indica]